MKLPEGAKRQKKCKVCGFVYEGDDIDKAFFKIRRKRRNNYFYTYDPTCRLCQQDARSEKTQRNRWRIKAIRTRQSHARKLGLTTKELEESYGWVIDTMAHDFEHCYSNECPECHKPFSSMGGGLGDITLDIWDRRIEPGYSNTKRMCKTCNLAKGSMTPEEWVAYKRLWRERERFLEEQAKIPKPIQLPFNFSEDSS